MPTKKRPALTPDEEARRERAAEEFRQTPVERLTLTGEEVERDARRILDSFSPERRA